MKDKLFDELVASVCEGGKILRGKTKPVRSFTFDVSEKREVAKLPVRQKELGGE